MLPSRHGSFSQFALAYTRPISSIFKQADRGARWVCGDLQTPLTVPCLKPGFTVRYSRICGNRDVRPTPNPHPSAIPGHQRDFSAHSAVLFAFRSRSLWLRFGKSFSDYQNPAGPTESLWALPVPETPSCELRCLWTTFPVLTGISFKTVQPYR